jgi:hypothetical protein
MRSIYALGCVLFAVSGAVSAQQVIWKCRDAKGAESFQNAPCGPGTREVRARVYETPQDSQAARLETERIRQEMDQRNASLHQPVYVAPRYAAPSARQLKQADCAAARRDALDAARQGVMSSQREWYERRAIDACFGL